MARPGSPTVLSTRQWIVGGFCFATGLTIMFVAVVTQVEWPTAPLYYLLGVLFLIQAADVARVL